MSTVQEHAAKNFTCASCKRVRPKSQRENRCRDRASCRAAQAQWLGSERFADTSLRLSFGRVV